MINIEVFKKSLKLNALLFEKYKRKATDCHLLADKDQLAFFLNNREVQVIFILFSGHMSQC